MGKLSASVAEKVMECHDVNKQKYNTTPEYTSIQLVRNVKSI